MYPANEGKSGAALLLSGAERGRPAGEFFLGSVRPAGVGGGGAAQGGRGSPRERCSQTREKGAGERGSAKRRGTGRSSVLTRAVTRACGETAQVCSKRTKFVSIREASSKRPEGLHGSQGED